MGMVQNYHFKKMMNEVLESNNPEEAHDLFTAFLGDDFEKEGKVKYRGLDVKYCISYTTYNREVIFGLTFRNRKDHDESPVWDLRMRLKRDDMKYLFDDLKSLIKMVQ